MASNASTGYPSPSSALLGDYADNGSSVASTVFDTSTFDMDAVREVDLPGNMDSDVDSDGDSVREIDGDDVASSIADAVREEFNVAFNDYDWHEFDFPDFNLDTASSGDIEVHSELDWVDDSLLDLVCAHELDADEKELGGDDADTDESGTGGADGGCMEQLMTNDDAEGSCYPHVGSEVYIILGQVQVENPLPGQDKWENTWQTEVFMTYFYRAVEAATEYEFELQCVILNDLSPSLAAYLERHWWKHKTKIVRCWTNKHFEYRDTSAVEGTHAQCKRWLQDSNGDLYTVFNRRLLPWWLSSASSVSIRAARDATILPYLLQNDRYTQVGRVITVWALRATDELWKEAIRMLTGLSPFRECTGVFRTVNGRPCVHELASIIRSNGRLKLLPTMFDPHWWIYRDRIETWRPRILELASLRTRRRQARSHRANHGVSGTAREPTLAERIDLNHPAPPPQYLHGGGGVVLTSSQLEQVHTGPTGIFSQWIQQDRAVESVVAHLDSQFPTIPPPRSHHPIQHQQQSQQSQQSYHQPHIPSRYWGYAGRQPF